MNDESDKINSEAIADEKPDVAEESESQVAVTEKPAKRKKPKFSGAYWYTATDEAKLAEQSFIRMLLTVIAFLLQVVVLLFPQGGLEYITNNIPSYAYVYMWVVFVFIGVAIYVNVMNFTRYKLIKRIPVERAPKNGFKRRSFFGAELFVIVNALLFVIELSFVCISFDGWGLAGMFVALIATAASVWARQVTVITLRSAELIPPPDQENETTEQNKE